MTYKLKGTEAVLDPWLAKEQDEDTRDLVLRWLFRLADDPLSVEATTVPIMMGLPLHLAVVPGTKVAVTYAVIKSPPYPPAAKAVLLRRIEATG